MSLETIPPKQYYRSAADWAVAAYPDEAKRSSVLKEIAAESVFELVKPGSLEDPDDWRFRDRREIIGRSFVIVVPGGRLWSRGAVISPDNKLIWDVSQEISFNPDEHSIFRETALPPAEYAGDNIAVVTFPVSVNYYHWMLDILPKFDLLRRSGIAVDKYMIVRDGMTDFQRFTLSVLGIQETQLIDCVHGGHWKAGSLIVPSNVMDKSRACSFLRETLMLNRGMASPAGKQRLYISRVDSRHRNVLNEDEVTAMLAGFGFRSVTLSGMSVDDQIRLFSSAEAIVAPHGAGLTNLAFCHPGTKIIEMFSPNYIDLSYWRLSSYALLDYYYLIGTGERPPEYVHVRILEDPITVDPSRLLRLLQEAGL